MKKIFLLFFLAQFSPAWSQINAGIGIHDVESCNFDIACSNLYIDTNSSNLWKIGNPHKVIFNSGISADKVIITDTSLNYPVNNYSSFVISTNFFYNYFDIIISFKHRYDTDTLTDGGFVEVSIDNGLNWYNVIEPNMPFGYETFGSENFYSQENSLMNNQFGFSGYTADWIESKFQWVFAYPMRQQFDTVLFRFNFLSDSIDNNKEGWIIDDFKIQYAEFYSGLNEQDFKHFAVIPNPASSSIRIEVEDSGPKKVVIRDLTNNEVEVRQISGNEIDINHLSVGIYYLTVETKAGIKVGKFVKE